MYTKRQEMKEQAYIPADNADSKILKRDNLWQQIKKSHRLSFFLINMVNYIVRVKVRDFEEKK